MQSAPAVSFPVGRSRFQRLFLIGVLGLGLALCALWTYSVPAADWRQWVCFALLLLVWVNAWHRTRQQESGLVIWTGQHWQWPVTSGSGGGFGQLESHLDFQFFMLLEFRADGGFTRWLWLDRDQAPGKWLAMRRALFAPKRTDSSALPGLGQGDTAVKVHGH